MCVWVLHSYKEFLKKYLFVKFIIWRKILNEYKRYFRNFILWVGQIFHTKIPKVTILKKIWMAWSSKLYNKHISYWLTFRIFFSKKDLSNIHLGISDFQIRHIKILIFHSKWCHPLRGSMDLPKGDITP